VTIATSTITEGVEAISVHQAWVKKNGG
jgi:hypothetical protein